MAQAVSRRPLTIGARASSCGICGLGAWTGFTREFFGFSLLMSFHRGCPDSCITGEMDSMTICGCSSETLHHPIDVKTTIFILVFYADL
jgi:hypothetical protein